MKLLKANYQEAKNKLLWESELFSGCFPFHCHLWLRNMEWSSVWICFSCFQRILVLVDLLKAPFLFLIYVCNVFRVGSNAITEPFVSFRINLYNKLEVPASIICLWGQLVQSSLHSYYLIFLLSKSQWLHANWLLEIVSHLCLVIHTPSGISWESASWSRKKKYQWLFKKFTA